MNCRWNGKFTKPGELTDADKAALFKLSDIAADIGGISGYRERRPGDREGKRQEELDDFALELAFGSFQGEPDLLTRRVRLTAEVRGIDVADAAPTTYEGKQRRVVESTAGADRARYLRSFVDAAASERSFEGVRGCEVVLYPVICSLDGVTRALDLPGQRWIVTTEGMERIGHFACPDCGPHVYVDEDGCCKMCGADCLVEPS